MHFFAQLYEVVSHLPNNLFQLLARSHLHQLLRQIVAKRVPHELSDVLDRVGKDDFEVLVD
jgi:hypothetical protein